MHRVRLCFVDLVFAVCCFQTGISYHDIFVASARWDAALATCNYTHRKPCTTLKYYAFFFSSIFQGNAYEILPGYTKEEAENIYGEMLRAVCTPTKFGVHYGAVSTR